MSGWFTRFLKWRIKLITEINWETKLSINLKRNFDFNRIYIFFTKNQYVLESKSAQKNKYQLYMKVSLVMFMT